MRIDNGFIEFSEFEKQALRSFMQRMDKEHVPTNTFPVSPQECLYWALGGPDWLEVELTYSNVQG